MRLKKIYLILPFFILGGLVFWYFQRNIFSKEVLKLEILASEQLDVGQEIKYALKYKNNGEITLTNAQLVFEYPENSLAEGGKLRVEKVLDDIYPGQEQTFDFFARLLGREGEQKKARAWLEFQPKNLKARYEVSTTQTTTLKFSPLTFELDLPSRLEEGKDFSFSLNYFSNIDYPLSQLRVKIEYPEGFEFVESKPLALENNEWLIPILNKAQGGRIGVSGRLKGGVGEQKLFKASLGLWQEGSFVLLKEAIKGSEIIKPNIYVSQLVNGSVDYLAAPGDQLHYEVFFKNIGQTPFENLFLVVSLNGAFFDFDSLRVQGATYHSGDNSLIWDWKKNPQLKFLGEDEEGKVEFWVNLKDNLVPDQVGSGPLVKDRVSLSSASEEFSLKVGSKMVLEQQVFYNDEVFGNTGPLPPRAGENTTYTVVWRLKNFYNDLRGVKVKAALPSWISLTGQLLPREVKFLFDSQSREIVWEAGDIAAGAGLNSESPQLFFQVSFAPLPALRGQAVEIVGQAQALGEDGWTRETIQTSTSPVRTDSLNDPGFNSQQGIVQ